MCRFEELFPTLMLACLLACCFEDLSCCCFSVTAGETFLNLFTIRIVYCIIVRLAVVREGMGVCVGNMMRVYITKPYLTVPVHVPLRTKAGR